MTTPGITGKFSGIEEVDILAAKVGVPPIFIDARAYWHVSRHYTSSFERVDSFQALMWMELGGLQVLNNV